MKFWHDDVRFPPDDSWVWCRTNADLIETLFLAYESGQSVSHLSLDHDMGLDGVDPTRPDAHLLAGRSTEDGTKLVRELTSPSHGGMLAWLIECRPRVVVHSMNSYAALRMVSILRLAGLRQTRFIPFRLNN